MKHLSFGPAEIYSSLVHRDSGRLVVHCVVRRTEVEIDRCMQCPRLAGLHASGLRQPGGVYIACRATTSACAPQADEPSGVAVDEGSQSQA
ncbi:MAG TPA: hypothetical protein VJV78_03375 [Polyangiales bacterium]|nr:hypothetical protein [Polyangiales bacterium]